MSQFFRTLLATITGCLISFILIIILLFVLISIISSAGDKKVVVKPQSILRIRLDHPIAERTSKDPFDQLDIFTSSTKRKLGLYDIVSAIRAAADNENIAALLIEPTLMNNIDYASLEEIRRALIDFKSSGKTVIAFADQLNQASYYLCTVADRIYLNPEGMFDFRGMVLQSVFFKQTLQKLDIQPIVIRHGRYKNAVENFTLEQMSEDNRHQFEVLLRSMWNNYLAVISEARNISVHVLDSLAEHLAIRSASDAYQFGLVDGLIYRDSLLMILRDATGSQEEIHKLRFVQLADYVKYHKQTETSITSPNRIAVIYVTGEIGLGEGSDESIGSDRISAAIRKARLDDKVKAIVLRVNSPGGSALASEIIWREVYLARQVKPVVVSMGNMAASGGYYISCAASRIIAQPYTLTGSIGVFGLFLNTQKFFHRKLGVTFDVVKTNKYSDMYSFTRDLQPQELAYLQMFVDSVYETFISRVADGRQLSRAKVDSIAQGRIWSGTDAMNVRLVDQMGGLFDAIQLAAQLSEVKDYRIIHLPEQKSFFEKVMKEYMSEKFLISLLLKISERNNFPIIFKWMPSDNHQIYTRLPYDIDIH